MLLVHEAFAGAWALSWHWGGGIFAILVLLALAYFSPLYKMWFLIAAGVVALCLVAYGVGIADQASRAEAQQKVIIKYVDKIVDRTKTKRYRAKPDEYDRRNY